MPQASGAVFVDLDRTLLRGASGPAFHRALVAEGVLSSDRHLPGDRYLYDFYNLFGETAPFIGLARAAARMMRGRPAAGTRRAGKRATDELLDQVQPWALEVLAGHRAEGRQLVLATTSPLDLVEPLAESLGFDAVVATRYQQHDGSYTGRLDGGFVWGTGKRAAVRRWAEGRGVDLGASHAYSDSFYDLPLLTAVGCPHPLNADPRLSMAAVARRWPLEYWDRAPGIPSLLGMEPYHVARLFFRAQAFPYARFDIAGVDHVPATGPVLLAANHRSYFDVAAIGMVAARLGRPVRFLAKQEVFDAPIVGRLARALGGIPVDRGRADRGSGTAGSGTAGSGTAGSGSSSGEPMRQAAAALRAGEVVIVLPQGTIPRGRAFFDPTLVGHTGTARLAAETGAPIVPLGLWGTEEVWPRSSPVPNVTALAHPPTVTVRLGPPVVLDRRDAVMDTEQLMSAIAGLLPDEARIERIPTGDELARTRPSA